MKSTTKILPLASLLATGLFVSAASSLHAQSTAQITTKQFFACYVPATGTVYLIKQPGLQSECASGHVQFSWTDGGSSPEVTPAAVITDANGWAATGTCGCGVIPVTGPGVRLMWYPRKAALRGGGVPTTQWDDVNIGNYSVALGSGTTASAEAATALGRNTRASGQRAIAMGAGSVASGFTSTAMGYTTTASGSISTALGQNSIASGPNSTAIGASTTASNNFAIAMGAGTRAIGNTSTAMGGTTTASGGISTAMGANTTASGGASTAMGSGTTAGGLASTAMGQNTTASGEASTAMGVSAIASGLRSIAMGSGPTASGNFSIAIGSAVTASGQRSVAMGPLASTNLRQGSFVYGDLSTSVSGAVVQATTDNSFVVRAAGGFRFRTSPDLTTGCDISGGIVPGNLTCSGTIQSASGGFRFPDGTVQTTAASGGTAGAQGLAAVNGSGGLIRGRNVSSVTRVRAGLYTVTFTSAVNVAAGFYVVTPGLVGTCATGASAENSGTVANTVTVVLAAGDCAFSLVVF